MSVPETIGESSYQETPRKSRDRLFDPAPRPAVRRVQQANGITKVYHGVDTSGIKSLPRSTELPQEKSAPAQKPLTQEEVRRHLRLVK